MYRRTLGLRPILATWSLATMAMVGCGGPEVVAPETAVPSAPVEVVLRTAELAALGSAAPLTGTLRAYRQVAPGSKLLGKVDAVLVREGGAVALGGLLARIESRDLEAAVAQAEAAVAMAEAQSTNAAAQRARMAELAGRGSATPKNLEDAIAGDRIAKAAVEQAEAGLRTAKVTLSYAEVRSPIAGSVVERRIEAGDMAVPGMPMFIVEDASWLEVELAVPESRLAAVAVGETARVIVLDRELEAKVERIVPAGDPASRSFTVKLGLANPDGSLRSGMFARVELEGAVRQGLSVERSAVVRRGQLDGLYVASPEGVIQLRWIRTGRAFGDRIEVLSGLEAGERYVSRPEPGLADGTAYRVRGES